MWLSLVERLVRNEEVAGSNPVIPTIIVLVKPFLKFYLVNATNCAVAGK
jgi:hypothetical protein